MIIILAFAGMAGFAQGINTRIFTIFTIGGCGCTGSGGAPKTFTTHEQVVNMLQKACPGIDFIVWKGTNQDGLTEIEKNKGNYHGMLVVGELRGDYRLAFTGLPTLLMRVLHRSITGVIFIRPSPNIIILSIPRS